MQDTSLSVYKKEVQPTLGKRQSEVLEAFKKKENFTNAELCEFLSWPINTITPRTNELVAMGYVEEFKKRPCKVTGRTAIAWQIKLNPGPVVQLPKINRGEWVFTSKTDPRKKYKVVDFTTTFICNCPAYQNHKPCWHIGEVKRQLLQPSKVEEKLIQPQLF